MTGGLFKTRRHADGDGEKGNFVLPPGKVQRTAHVEYLQCQVKREIQKKGKINNDMRVKTKVKGKFNDYK